MSLLTFQHFVQHCTKGFVSSQSPQQAWTEEIRLWVWGCNLYCFSFACIKTTSQPPTWFDVDGPYRIVSDASSISPLFLPSPLVQTSSLSSRSGTLSFSILSARLVLILTNLFCLSSAVSDATVSAVFRLRTSSLSASSSGVSDCILAVAFCLRTSSLAARFSDVSNSIRAIVFRHTTASLSARSSGVSDWSRAAVFCCTTASLSVRSCGVSESSLSSDVRLKPCSLRCRPSLHSCRLLRYSFPFFLQTAFCRPPSSLPTEFPSPPRFHLPAFVAVFFSQRRIQWVATVAFATVRCT